MIIQVLHTYGGRLTKREKILPGVYDTEHNALYGIAQYLVDNGHAIQLADEYPAPVAGAIQSAQKPEDFATALALTPNRLEVSASGNLVATKQEPLSLTELRARYKELAGKGASPKWDAETLLAKIAELESGNA